MKKTLEKINELLEKGIIQKYAIAGGIAQFYYIEPSVTYDLDISVSLKNVSLNPLAEIFSWSQENGYSINNEHFIIEGNPVQFLIYDQGLEAEALSDSVKITLFETETYIIKAEFLMAIMLKVFRPKDKVRLAEFIKNYDYDQEFLISILNKYHLKEKFDSFINNLSKENE